MNIYIANLENSINNDSLKDLFASYGEVISAEVAYDVFTGGSRGFGYVEMHDNASAEKAISELNNTNFRGLVITVQEAAPKIVRKGSYKVGEGVIKEYKFKKN